MATNRETIGDQVNDALTEAQEKLDRERERSQELENENTDLRQSLLELEDTVSSQADQIDDLYEGQERWQAELENHERSVEAHQAEFQALRTEMEEHRRTLEDQMSTIAANNQDQNSPSHPPPPSPGDQTPPSENPPPTPPTETPTNTSSTPLPENPAPALNPAENRGSETPRAAPRYRLT